MNTSVSKKRHGRFKLLTLLSVVFFFMLYSSKAYGATLTTTSALVPEGTYYSVLMDISGSIPDEVFISARDGVKNFAHQTKTQDTMSVVTFGDDVKEVANFAGGVPATADNALTVLDTILPDNQTTKFYEALQFLEKRSDAATQTIKRAVFVTDGVDVSDFSKETANALMSSFYDRNIRIYGVLVQSNESTPETSEQFTTFCEKTGGAVEVVNGTDGKSAFDKIAGMITSAHVIEEETERFQEAYQEAGEVVPIEEWTAGIAITSSASSSSSSEETSISVQKGTEGDRDGNGILDEYENGGAKNGTGSSALDYVRPYIPLFVGIGGAILALIIVAILISRRSGKPKALRTNGAGEKDENEGGAEKPAKKEKEKREKNKDKVEFFFSEKDQ